MGGTDIVKGVDTIPTGLLAERGFLVGTKLRNQDRLWRAEDSLEELVALARTAGVEVVGTTIQRLDAPHPAYYIGTGKVKQLREQQRELGHDLVIFDDELRPRHQRNLEKALGIRVVDRTALILDIFAKHARTKEGRLQVELAQYEYLLPRLTRLWTHLSRQGVGGVGLRGPGETQLEVDRRQIRRRINHLKHRLEQVRAHRRLYRRRRRRAGIPVVAIVGYTNAGKSTLLNAISQANVLVEDALFTTLDPTTRRVTLPRGTEALFTDTVGFMQRLPTALVAAFQATLEEIREATILLHIVDITHSHVHQQVHVVGETLEGLGAADRPVLTALNKIDLLEDTEPVQEMVGRYPHSVAISAREGIGLDKLLARVEAILDQNFTQVRVHIPYERNELVALFHEEGIVGEEEHTPDGIMISGKVPARLTKTFREVLL